MEKILVIDVEAKYTAVVGDNMMKFAYENNWSGIVVNVMSKAIQNTKEIDVTFALWHMPKKTIETKDGVLSM